MGKGGGRNNNTTNFAPPSWAMPLYKKMASDLMNLYDSGKGGNIYNGKQVSDLSDASKNAISGLIDTANKFNNPYLNNLLNGKVASKQNLNDIASGKLIGNNQAFQSSLNNVLDAASDKINSSMSGAGRYGSGANSAILANKLGNIAQAANAQQYSQDINNMMRANSQIDAANANRAANYINYLNSQGNALSRALDGAKLIDVNNQKKLDANKQNFIDNDNMALNRLKMFEDLLRNGSGNYGSRTSTSFGSNPATNGNFFKKLLGK